MASTIESMRDALQFAEPRPAASDSQAAKKNYAERLSRAIAIWIANSLRKDFPGVMPDREGRQQESRARTSKGVKKLDVNYSTIELGLGLGVSIKTINYRDRRTGRYTKNYTRADNELRAEAKDYHQRQPYAVMIAAIFLPADSCLDGVGNAPSSFGSAVKAFRHRAGRRSAGNEQELFERIFVGVYDTETSEVWFFDVVEAPPRRGAPPDERRLTFADVIASIRSTYDARNRPPFVWYENEDTSR